MEIMIMQGERLRDELRKRREAMNSSHATRLHRAVSWLRCAEKYTETDDDISFISMWISFNALYSIDDNQFDHSFRGDFDSYAQKLVRLDKNELIYECLWSNFSGFVRLLIDNKYVYGPYWQSQRDGNDQWIRSFENNKKRAMHALANSDVAQLLKIVMERLYVLRNQLVHGGATWQSGVNREQVRDGKRVLLELIPLFIELMFEENDNWGEVFYPVMDLD
jgi:hypothetical protein